MTTIERRAIEWIASDDTGMSSMTIWRFMMDVRCEWPTTPYDSDDFGRCWRLIRLIPEWRKRLPEMAKRHPAWREIVERWDEYGERLGAKKWFTLP